MRAGHGVPSALGRRQAAALAAGRQEAKDGGRRHLDGSSCEANKRDGIGKCIETLLLFYVVILPQPKESWKEKFTI